jgi:hypothetical protein
MKTEKEKTYELRLTPQQQAEMRELTGKDLEAITLKIEGEVITFEVEQLEERIAPRLASN